MINDSTHRQLFAKILGEVYLEVQGLSECIPSRLHHQPQHAIIFKKRLTSLWPVTTLAILSMRLPYFFPLALIRSKNLSFFQEGLHVIQYPSHSGVPKHFPGLLGCLEIEHAVTDRDKKQHSLVALSATKSLDAPDAQYCALSFWNGFKCAIAQWPLSQPASPTPQLSPTWWAKASPVRSCRPW